MSKNENARYLNRFEAVSTASINLLSFKEDKGSGNEQRTRTHPGCFIDADEEQAVWENYIRRGTPHGNPAPVIIAREITDSFINTTFVEVKA